MYFIVNNKKNEIVISDLKLCLGPRQAMDLDKIFKREQIEYSKDLKLSVKKGIVTIRQKSSSGTEHQNVIINSNSAIGSEDIEKIKNELTKEIRDGIGSIRNDLEHQEGNKQILPVNPNLEMSELKNMLSQLTSVVGNMSKNSKIDDNNKELEEEEVDVMLDEEVLADINARAVNKIVEGSNVNSMKYKEEIKKDDLITNIDELEQFLD